MIIWKFYNPYQHLTRPVTLTAKQLDTLLSNRPEIRQEHNRLTDALLAGEPGWPILTGPNNCQKLTGKLV